MASKPKQRQTTIGQVYLGWDRPILHAARDYLRDRFLRGDRWDMDDVLIVLPSSWAGRRLAELLAEYSQQQRCLLRPPEIVTVGTLPEKMYQPRFPFASELIQILCWTKVLRESDADQLMPLLVDVPSHEIWQPWVDLAGMLSSLHRELATDLMLFSDVADRLQGTFEESRWRVLEKLQRRYLDELDRHRLWDIQTARRVAIDRGEPTTDQQIIVLGAVDLNRAQRRFLDAVADRVTVLIGAPNSWSEGFDPHGALQPSFWQDLKVTVDSKCLHVRGTAVEAAAEAVRQLAYLPNGLATSEVVVGVPDTDLIPLLVEQFDRAHFNARYGAGSPVIHSSPMQLLSAMTDYLESGDYHAFAALMRLPAVSKLLRARIELPVDYLRHVDIYFNRTLLRSVNAAQWPVADSMQEVQAMVAAIDEWLQPLRSPPQPLSKWSASLLQVLQSTYELTVLDLNEPEDDVLYDACSQITQALASLDDVPMELQFSVSFAEAMTWVRRLVDKARTPPPADPAAIEMLGWLDLALDDGQALILTGLHDASVPESINADAFLPNELRKDLGLIDNAMRYARDCYVLQAIMHTRNYLSIVLNQLSTDGDPLTPSRLLLAVPSDELGPRVHRLLIGLSDEELPTIDGRWKPRAGQSNLPIPKPTPCKVPQAIPVTDFRRYLECKYRYYLSQILRLESVDDRKVELEANDFGNLIHDCLFGLKDSDVARSIDPQAVADWLVKELDRLAKSRFGVSPPVPVQIQIEQARQRLVVFAEAQANRAREGWEIREAEFGVSASSPINLGTEERPVWIYGRMDRIDYQDSTTAWAIWDYKTGDSSKSPLSAHVSRGDHWSDFQLPLYRRLGSAASIPEDAKVELGYIQLPKTAANIQFETAEFEAEKLSDAYEQVQEIYSRIQSGEFWPPNPDFSSPWDDFSVICQTNVARRWSEELAIQEMAEAERVIGAEQGENRSGPRESVMEEPAMEVVVVDRSTRQLDIIPEFLRLKPVVMEGNPPAEWFNPLVIRASAGTGKTYSLAIRMMQLLFTDQPLDHVLATTFTRKAAGEILNRVLLRLADAITSPDSLAKLQATFEPLQITRQHCEYQLARLCSQLHRFRVCTLDSFYNQLASSFSLELELPPGWNLVDPYMEKQLRDLAIARMFETHKKSDLRTLVGMLFKGESGRSVQGQIRSVVENGYGFYRVTDESAWHALDVKTPPSPERYQAALEVLKDAQFDSERSKKSWNALLEAIVGENWELVIRSTFVINSNAKVPKYSNKLMPPDVVDGLQVVQSQAVSREMQLKAAQTRAAYELLHSFHQEFEFVKRQNRAVSFEDISLRLARWIATKVRPRLSSVDTSIAAEGSRAADESGEAGATGDTVRALIEPQSIDFRMDSRVDHLLLDEFQDTSPVQWDIVRPFAEAITRASLQKNTSFFCVGDTKQAIYGWRGGVAQIFESVSQQIRGVQEQLLAKSFRSSPIIMDLVNQIFRNLDKHENFGTTKKRDDSKVDTLVQVANRKAATAWMEKFPNHETALEDLPGYVVLKNGPATSAPSDDESEGSVGSLMEQAAIDIANLAREAPHISIGVLVRTNENVGHMIHLLREQKMDASQEGGNPLTDSAAVELILSLIQVADHPADRIAAFHVKHSPMSKRLETDAWTSTDRLAEAVRKRVVQNGYGHTIAYYCDLLAEECNERDQQRLEQLIQLAYRYDDQRTNRVRDFVQYVRETKVALPRPSQIRVMNVHQSKGLEFDAVFLADLNKSLTGQTPLYVARYQHRAEHPTGVVRYCNQQLQPHLNTDWKDVFEKYAEQQMSESLCILYVALTRAKQALYLYTSPRKSAILNWGSVLQSILVPNAEERSQADRILYSMGDEHWYRKAPSGAPELVESVSPSKPRRLKIRLTRPKEGEQTRMRRTTKPSAAGEARMVSLRAALQLSESVGAIVGTVIHRWFEEVEWLDTFAWDRAAMRSLALKAMSPEDMTQVDLNQLLDSMQNMLQLPSVRKALSSDRYDDWRQKGIDELLVDNELRLLELMDGYLLRGTIDRLVLGLRQGQVVEAEILDYKTDALNPRMSRASWIADRAEHHRPQLELYRRVLSQQYQLAPERVRLTLILLSADHLENLG